MNDLSLLLYLKKSEKNTLYIYNAYIYFDEFNELYVYVYVYVYMFDKKEK